MQLFKFLDTDNNGSVDIHDFRKAMDSVKGNVICENKLDLAEEEEDPWWDPEVKAVFDALDVVPQLAICYSCSCPTVPGWRWAH